MISLELAKQHQRIDGSEEDDLLQFMLDAAVTDCTAYLNRPLYASEEAKAAAEANGSVGGVVLNSAITAAMLLMFGYLYMQREDSGENGLPQAARRILDNYRRLPGV